MISVRVEDAGIASKAKTRPVDRSGSNTKVHPATKTAHKTMGYRRSVAHAGEGVTATATYSQREVTGSPQAMGGDWVGPSVQRIATSQTKTHPTPRRYSLGHRPPYVLCVSSPSPRHSSQRPNHRPTHRPSSPSPPTHTQIHLTQTHPSPASPPTVPPPSTTNTHPLPCISNDKRTAIHLSYVPLVDFCLMFVVQCVAQMC